MLAIAPYVVPPYPQRLVIPHDMTKAQERRLQALADAANPQDGRPLDWRGAAALVRRGWAERGSRYPLYRITEAGRQALAAERTGDEPPA